MERDLHDGAQQRLVTTRLLLAIALERDGDHPMVADALREVAGAIGELRDLARGVHPATVTEHGLSVAIESLAERAPLPVAVYGTAPRLAPLSEVTAYFVVAEALTNVAKHAQATHAQGGTSIDPDVVMALLQRRRRVDPLAALTPREREVLALMAEGKSNTAIAATLVLSAKTIESHVSQIFTKLDLGEESHRHRRVAAVLSYLRHAATT